MISVVLISVAVIPALYLILQVRKYDRLEKEPVGLIVSIVILGMLSTFIAMFLELVLEFLLANFVSYYSPLYNIILYFIVVALSEEWVKYLMLKLRTWKSRAFNCSFDGIVYAVSVSLGFALFENIMYVTNYGLSTGLIRAVTAIPGHACFGVYMGFYYGLAKYFDIHNDKINSKKYLRYSVWIPVLLHGLYDYIASAPGYISLVVFVIFIAIMFKSSLNMVKRLSNNDIYID